MTPSWPALMNSCSGRPAVVIGKGPTLDAWLAAGCPQPEGAVRIGVNQVAEVVPEVPFSVSGDCQMNHYLHLPTQWVRGLPYRENSCTIDTPPRNWIEVHVFHTDVAALHLTREEIAKHPRLFKKVCSTNHAVHFAWYLGCSSLLLVGIDGGSSRSEIISRTPDRPPPPSYDFMLSSVRDECDILYGRRWSHWAGK